MFTIKCFKAGGKIRHTYEAKQYSVYDGETDDPSETRIQLLDPNNDRPSLHVSNKPTGYVTIIVENSSGKTTDIFRAK